MDVSSIATSEWASATIALLVGLILAYVLKRSIEAAAKPLRLEQDVARVLTRITVTLVMIFTVVGALNQLGVEIGPLLGALGIGSVLIALALQPVLGNLVGSVMLDARRPIRRGDQIHSNGQSGTVVDINGRAVVLKTFDGEVVYVPNLKVLDEPLVNQTRDEYRRTVMPFLVAYDTDLRHAQKVLVTELRSLPALELAPPADVIVTGFGESGVDMAARFWHPSEELTARWVISEVAIAIRETLAREGITIPFPQVVFHPAPGNPANRSDASRSGA
ncbi:MAG: mechanosensitive ion channel family protein, partial [Acidimicrobiia bacterium]|nr:mechanosensitive ion channel family protein [Acidimicrobiia bacterium]